MIWLPFMNNVYNAVKSNLTLANEEGSFGSVVTIYDTEGTLCMGPHIVPALDTEDTYQRAPVSLGFTMCSV